MSNEITLCRAKELNSDEWIYGYHCKVGPTDNQTDYIIPDYASALYSLPIRPSTLCRFTGKYDTNGRMIFEGDIICNYTDCHNYWSTVKWDNNSFGFIIQDGEDTLWLYEVDKCEVVGNIWDNGDDPAVSDDECCFNCKLCDKTCGYCCTIRSLNIDDPYSDWCGSFQFVNNDNEKKT